MYRLLFDSPEGRCKFLFPVTMQRLKGFPYKSLKLNLEHGRGANTTLDSVSKIVVVFGSTKCPSLGPLNSFYVNELPRLHKSSKFTVETREEPISKLLITKQGKEQEIDIATCKQASQIYEKLMAQNTE